MHLAQLSWGKFVPNMTFFFPTYLQTEPVPELRRISRRAVNGVLLLGDMLKYQCRHLDVPCYSKLDMSADNRQRGKGEGDLVGILHSSAML